MTSASNDSYTKSENVFPVSRNLGFLHFFCLPLGGMFRSCGLSSKARVTGVASLPLLLVMP